MRVHKGTARALAVLGILALLFAVGYSMRLADDRMLQVPTVEAIESPPTIPAPTIEGQGGPMTEVAPADFGDPTRDPVSVADAYLGRANTAAQEAQALAATAASSDYERAGVAARGAAREALASQLELEQILRLRSEAMDQEQPSQVQIAALAQRAEQALTAAQSARVAAMNAEASAERAVERERRERLVRGCAEAGVFGTQGCPSLGEIVRDATRPGEVAFTNIPQTMRIRRTYRVRAAATREMNPGAATAALAEAEPSLASEEVESHELELLPAMDMELAGSGFEIRRLTGGEQTIPPDGAAEWEWEVTPTAPGTRELRLTAWGVLRFGPNDLSPVRIETMRRDVDVEVHYVDWALIAWDYLSQRWAAVAGVIAGIGIAIATMLRWMRRRKARSATTGEVG